MVAHSYGTTTSAIALAHSDVRVESFVSLASAGLPRDLDRATDLNADAVYAGQAKATLPFVGGDGDHWAGIGRALGDHPVDPMGKDFDAHRFGTDTEGSGLTPVRDHATHTDKGEGYLDAKTESLLNVARATTGQGDGLTPSSR